ncbi:uncharacterized protein B0I36DRAFT_387133 [Microdochium trichocladiopsis]|uniref:Apple domain-containing protein n=1 Tax=Microdochium trichocladiopsis TaxID=1682393 RepID=A0A9P8XXF2_9PEZI|nr:uncharacterized protein B0I36DRAFT_387133 [Microdochium trichocladiopsis]KAH7024601.1 hypothetical protein B0I36DRAFT_387133 [Microdochium trichocladiopsis]
MKAAISRKLAVLAVCLSTFSSAAMGASCPENDGEEVKAPGKVYKLWCKHAQGAANSITKPCSSIDECAQLCAAAGNDCLHGQFQVKTNECFLRSNVGSKTPQTYANGHVLQWIRDEPIDPVDGSDGTGTTTPPPSTDDGTPTDGSGLDKHGNKLVYKCGDDHGDYFEADNGRVFKLYCSHGSYIADIDSFASTSLRECAEKCALRSDCKQVDFDGTTCHIKGASKTPASWTGHVWVATTCPKTRATAQNKDPATTTDVTCPQNDGKIFEGSDGTWFYNQCCADTDAASVLGYKTAKDQKDCAELCVQDKACKSALFVTETGGQPENCKLYGHGSFSTTVAEGAHYMFVTDPPTSAAKLSESKLCSTECPGADGQIYASVTGENYQMFCKKRHGTNYLKIERRPNFEACIASCAATPACDSADYEPRTKKCFFSNDNNLPTIDAPAFMSAHSLGCAGACASCNKDKGCNATKEALGADEASCPDNDGEIITSNLLDFRLQCKHCFTSATGSYWSLPGKTVEDCAAHCAKDSRCVGVNLIKDACWMHPARGVDGNEVGFKKSDECHAMAPFDRGHADKPTA